MTRPAPCIALLALGSLCSAASGQDALDKVVAFDAGAGERMGHVVSDGATLAIGVPLDADQGDESGSVYVYRRSGHAWVFDVKLLPDDGEPGGRFGPVALDGDTLVVGAFWHDGAGVDAGKVYVFERDGTTWTQVQALTASDAAPGDTFGLQVDLVGDLLVVGAPHKEVVGFFSGVAYVFRRVNGVWQEEQRLEGSAPHAQAFLGTSVSTDGTTIVVGGHFGAFGGVATGAAHVFRTVGGTWVEEARLSPSDGEDDDQFGIATAVEGDTVVVGAHRGDAAYVFTLENGSWTERARLEGADVRIGDFFGQSLDLVGERIVVGSPRDDDLGTGSGAVYVFEGSGPTWTETAKLLSPDQANNAFGSRVELDGSLLAISAPFDDEGAFNAGAVHLVKLDGSGDVVCAGAPNSVGSGARTWTSGSIGVADEDFALHVSDAPPGTFGLFVHGVFASGLPFGDGTLCISPFGPGIHRNLPVLVMDDGGFAQRLLDLGDLAGVGAVLPGTSWTFQCIYRDSGPGSTGMNLSDALRVDFLP